MAAAKKPAVDIVFGMGGGKPDPAGDDELAESRDTLKSAFEDAGVDASDALLDALHAYIKACEGAPPPMAEEESEGEY